MPNDPEQNSSAPRELGTKEHTELLAVYQVIIGDIAFWKSQQWKVTNYSILVYVAILGTAKIFDDANVLVTVSTVVLLLLGFAVLLLSFYVLNELEQSLKKSRERLERIVQSFMPYTRQDILQHSVSTQGKPTLIRMFRFIVAVGFLIVLSILWVWMCGI